MRHTACQDWSSIGTHGVGVSRTRCRLTRHSLTEPHVRALPPGTREAERCHVRRCSKLIVYVNLHHDSGLMQTIHFHDCTGTILYVMLPTRDGGARSTGTGTTPTVMRRLSHAVAVQTIPRPACPSCSLIMR